MPSSWHIWDSKLSKCVYILWTTENKHMCPVLAMAETMIANVHGSLKGRYNTWGKCSNSSPFLKCCLLKEANTINNGVILWKSP